MFRPTVLLLEVQSFGLENVPEIFLKIKYYVLDIFKKSLNAHELGVLLLV